MSVCETTGGPSIAERRNGAFVDMLQTVQNEAEHHRLDLRFVGGVITDLVGPETSIGHIDFEGRHIWLDNTLPIRMMREKDHTAKDIDALALAGNKDTIALVKDAAREVNNGNRRRDVPSIPVSIEAAHAPGSKPWYKPQLVSFVEVDGQGRYFLTFDSIREEVDPETLAGWTYHVQNDGEELQFVGFNPYAHFQRYFERNPSGLKQKDKGGDKIANLAKLAHEFVSIGKDAQIDYYTMYKSWRQFNRRLLVEQPGTVAFKSRLLKLYWDTVGTALSHGSLPGFGWTANLADRFGR